VPRRAGVLGRAAFGDSRQSCSFSSRSSFKFIARHGPANPGAVHGGAYAPYVIERFTKLAGSELTVYYVLSTWNPYVVVLMKSRLQVE
jgi:hypothetical protein